MGVFVPSSSLSILLPLLLCSFAAHHVKLADSLPLSTNSRWIVDSHTGNRVKLACVNWVSHLDAVVAEGLSRKPLDVISKQIRSMGFNCVRLTWPLHLAINNSLASLTVRQSFQNVGLTGLIPGIQQNNPAILDLSLIQTFQAVVSNLGDNDVMVVIDNHLTRPGWCCNNNDGNGFFNDKYFNPDQWIQGLTKMAPLFKGVSNVIGMSLRNELRGPRQNVPDWFKYMQKGAEAVHSANPNVLVILSGLSFDTNLSFLKNQQVNISFTGKLVYEMHWYRFTEGGVWQKGNANKICANAVSRVMGATGFLVKQGYPLFLSEFGVDQIGKYYYDNRYLNCLMGVAAELDLDWAYWTLVQGYYLREGVIKMRENYGVLDWNNCEIKNTTLLKKISVLQYPFQGPGLTEAKPHKVIFHPSTGLCVQKNKLRLGGCQNSEAWIYTAEKRLKIMGTDLCVQAYGLGRTPKLGVNCNDSSSKWEMTSASMMHFQSHLKNGMPVCLDVNGRNKIVTKSCKCLDVNGDYKCEPSSQWFKLVDSTRR